MQASRGMEHWVQFLVWKWEKDQFEGGEIWMDDLYQQYVVWVGRMGWRHETEKVFISCVDRMLGGVYDKVRRRKRIDRWTGRSGVHTEYAMRNRLKFHGNAEVSRRIANFVGSL
jgi:hypothetical protein